MAERPHQYSSQEILNRIFDPVNNRLLVDARIPYVSKSGAYTTTINDRIIGVDTSGGPITITLGSASVEAGKCILIKDITGNAAANNITVATEGAETIDGAGTLVINTAYEAIGVFSDGTNWFQV
jgi:hypothetical protein